MSPAHVRAEEFRPGDIVALTDGRLGQVWALDDMDRVQVAMPNQSVVVKSPTALKLMDRQIPDRHPNMTARLVKARRPHLCDGPEHGDRGPIAARHQYVRAVAFPGHESHVADADSRPSVLRLCLTCAARYPSTDPRHLATRSTP